MSGRIREPHWTDTFAKVREALLDSGQFGDPRSETVRRLWGVLWSALVQCGDHARRIELVEDLALMADQLVAVQDAEDATQNEGVAP
jgi:hypothetical protein